MDRERNRTLCRRLSRLLGQVAKKPQAEAVHQFRTTSRRIEAILEAVAAEPDRNQRKLMRRLAKLRRRAGRVRDMDVQMALLRTLKIGRDGHRKERLMEALADLRPVLTPRQLLISTAASVHSETIERRRPLPGPTIARCLASCRWWKPRRCTRKRWSRRRRT